MVYFHMVAGGRFYGGKVYFYHFNLFFFVFFVFLGLHPWHMEVPRLGVELELQLPAYTTATAMPDPPDPSHVCDLPPRSWQYWILNPLSEEARDRTCNPVVSSWIHFCCATTELQISSSFETGKR